MTTVICISEIAGNGGDISGEVAGAAGAVVVHACRRTGLPGLGHSASPAKPNTSPIVGLWGGERSVGGEKNNKIILTKTTKGAQKQAITHLLCYTE